MLPTCRHATDMYADMLPACRHATANMLPACCRHVLWTCYRHALSSSWHACSPVTHSFIRLSLIPTTYQTHSAYRHVCMTEKMIEDSINTDSTSHHGQPAHRKLHNTLYACSECTRGRRCGESNNVTSKSTRTFPPAPAEENITSPRFCGAAEQDSKK